MRFGELVMQLLDERGMTQMFATVAVRNLDPKTAQSIMGHSNINMTMKYADTEESQVRDASRLLPF